MLVRFDPFRDLERARLAAASMPMDAYRTGDTVTVQFDLPGVDPASVEVTVDEQLLTVQAERSWTRDEGTEIYAAERRQGSFRRQLRLADTLDTDNIEAGWSNGVLTLRIPVAEAAKPRRIEIAAAA